MSTTLIATLGGLWTALLWGAADWMDSRLSKKLAPIEANLVAQLPGLVTVAAMLASGQSLPSLTHSIGLFLGALLFTASYMTFIKALSLGYVGVVAPVANTYPLLAVILSVTFLSLSFSGLQYLAVLVIILGVLMLAFEKKGQKIPKPILRRELFWALATATLWGVGTFLLNVLVDKENWLVILGSINFYMISVGIILVIATGGFNRLKPVMTNKTGLMAGSLTTLGSIGWYSSSGRAGSYIIPSVIASSSPLIASYFGALFDKERLTLIKRIGAVVVVAGIILLNLT